MAWLFATAAWAVNYTGDICVTVDVDYADLAGDRWLDNAVNRPGRGLEVKVTDSRNRTFNLDGSGCLRLTVDNALFNVTVYSRAVVNSVPIESWEGDSRGPRPVASQAFHFLSATAPGGFSHALLVSGTDKRWKHLLAATMVFKDQTWKVDQPITRNCCVSGALQDGTCQNPAAKYQPRPLPVHIQTWVDQPGSNDDPPDDCCQSRLVTKDAAGNQVDDGPGVFMGAGASRFNVAYEIGHVVAFLRAGEQELFEANVDEDNCAGDYRFDKGQNAWVHVDQSGYSVLSKEHVSVALKEGWANFVAAATWNARENNCDFQGNNEHDWDLDGIFDLGPLWRAVYPDDYRVTDGVVVDIDNLARTIDCEGDPDVEGMYPHPYTWPPPGTGTIDGRNWLADLEAAPDPAGCVADPDPNVEANRTSLYDVTRMYWDLYTKRSVAANNLSDLHVDACFRTWSTADLPSTVDPRLPWVRLAASALHNNLGTAFTAEADHVAH